MSSTSTKKNARRRGTGSVQSKRNGRGLTYYAVVALDGKRKWLKAGPTYADAENLLHQVFAGTVDPRSFGGNGNGDGSEHASATDAAEPPWSFAEYAEAWIDLYSRRPKKPETKAEYRRIVRNVLVPCLGPKMLADIEPRDAWQLVAQRIDGTAPVGGRCHKQVSLERALRELAVLRKMLNDAIKQQLLHDDNPCAGLADDLRDEFEHEGRERVVLSREQTDLLITEIGHEHKLLVLLLARCGLRIGEALGLRVSDFDAGAGLLRIAGAWSH